MYRTTTVSDNQIQQLQGDGYVVFPQVLSADEIDKIRAFLEKKLKNPLQWLRQGNTDGALLDIYSRYKQARWLLYHKGINDILRALLKVQSPINLRATALLHQRTSYWHNEGMDFEDVGYSFHREPNCILLQTVVQLQDQSPEYGASLDIDVGSHKLPDPFVPLDEPKVFSPRHLLSLHTRKGDLLVFDWRLAHRAVPAHDTGRGAAKKLGIFGSYTNDAKYADLYHQFLDSSERFEYMHGLAPPKDLVKEAKEHSVTLV